MSNDSMAPIQVTVKAGEKKAFCTCQKSQNMPYCDGAHKGTAFQPHIAQFKDDATLYLCGCGKSGQTPYCDGAHQH
ncbi:CDGSH iron-sulfur domain-containing protein [Magnetococcus sp. PR-3]|uniref:CDGSH iron-sulfur domain-containing protein n=1 Tax=Magnetococcus sp. PR-3 TaxID=3120355 RepID=UPI002FCE439D